MPIWISLRTTNPKCGNKANRGKWAAIRDWLNETEYGDLFDAATEFREYNADFIAALSAVQSRLGFTHDKSASLALRRVQNAQGRGTSAALAFVRVRAAHRASLNVKPLQ